MSESSDTEKTDDAITSDEPKTVASNAIPFNGGGITVEINGEKLTLPPKNGDYMLLDLLDSANIDDPTVPGSEIVLEINGVPANFSSYITDGDKAVIKVQERKYAK